MKRAKVIDPAALSRAVAESVEQPSFGLVDPAGQLALDLGLIATAAQVAQSDIPDSPAFFAHTGSTAMNDQERCIAALVLLSAGVSRRQIAALLNMSRNTLHGIEDQFEKAGKLEPLKRRVERALHRLVHDATIEASETVADGKRSLDAAAWLKALSQTFGIGFDKVQLSTGQATGIIEQRSGPNWDEARAEMARLMQVVDVESTGLEASGVGLQQVTELGAGLGAGNGLETGLIPAPKDGGQEAGGGGSPRAGAGGIDDGSRGAKILTQGPADSGAGKEAKPPEATVAGHGPGRAPVELSPRTDP